MNLQGKIVIYHCEAHEQQLNNGNLTVSALVLYDWGILNNGLEDKSLNLRVFFDSPEVSPEGYKTSVPHGNNPGDWSLIEETN